MAGEDDVTIKIAGDVKTILDALEKMSKAFDKATDGVKDFAKEANKDLTKVHELLAAQLLQTQKWGEITNANLEKMRGGLGATTSELTKAVTLGSFFGNVMSKGLDLVVDGVMSAVHALPELIKQTAEAGDHFLVLSHQTGVSVEALSQLQYVGEQAGVSLETMTRNIFVMSKNLGGASKDVRKAVGDLHLDLGELRSMKPEDAFIKLNEALKGVPNAAKQASIGTELFGKGFRSMRQLAEEDIRGLMKEADDLGLTWTKAAAQMADKFNDASNKLHRVFDGLKQQLGMALLPAATAVMQTLADTFAKMMSDMGLSTGKWQDTMQSAVRGVLVGFATLIESMAPIVAEFSKFIVQMAKTTIDELTHMIAPWAVFIEMLTDSKAAMFALHEATNGVGDALAAGLRGPLTGMMTALVQGKAAITKFEPVLQEFADKGVKAMQGFAGRVVKTFDKIIESVKKGKEAAAETGDVSPVPIEQLEKFKKTIQDLQESLDLARKAGYPIKSMMESFGPAAMKAVEAGAQLPGGIEMITADILQLAQTANSVEMVKIIESWAVPIEKSIGTWEDFGKKVGEITEQMWKDMFKIFTVTKDFTKKLEDVGKTGIEKTLSKLADDERAALAALPAPIPGQEAQWQAAHDAITKFYADARIAATKYTGDVERDAEMRGEKTKAELGKELKAEELHLANMLRNRQKFTYAAIVQQKQIVAAARKAESGAAADAVGAKRQAELDDEVKTQKDALTDMLADRVTYNDKVIALQKQQVDNAKQAAGYVVVHWKQAMNDMAQAFLDLSKTSEGMFGKITNAAGQTLLSMKGITDTWTKASEGFKKTEEGKFSFSGLVSGISGIAGMAGQAIQLGQLLWKTFAKSKEQMVAEESLRDFGVNLSDALQKSIVEASKGFAKKGGGRMSAELSKLADIIKEGGGLSGKNVAQFGHHMHDMFSEFDRGVFSVEDLTKALKDTLPIFAEFATTSEAGMLAFTDAASLMITRVKSGAISAKQAADTMDASFDIIAQDAIKNNTVISQSYLNLAKDAKAAGIEMKSTLAFQEAMQKKLASGLKAAVGKIPEVTKGMDTLFKSFSQKQQDQLTADYERVKKRAKDAKEDFTQTFEEFIVEQGNFYSTLKEDDKRLQTVFYGGDLTKFNEAKAAWQGSFDRLSRITLASFNSMVANGKSAVDAMLEVGDSVDILIDRQSTLGLQGNSAFDSLKRFRGLIKDNEELVTSVGGLNEVMLALANTGSLTQETFNDIEAEGVDSFEKLKKAGFTENEALAQMKPFLQTALKLQKERGLTIDDNTQKLITQATEQGIISKEEASVQDVLKEGLAEIIKALKGDIPAAWQVAGKAGVDAAAAQKAEQDKLNAAIALQNKKLEQVDWDKWEREGTTAAKNVKGAIDEVTFGASPGGIVDVMAHLLKASDVTDDFASEFTKKMGVAADAARALSEQSITGDMTVSAGAAKRFTGTAVAAGSTNKVEQLLQQLAAASDQPGEINLVLTDQTSYGTEAHVEKVVLPNLITILRRGRRLRDLQSALEIAG